MELDYVVYHRNNKYKFNPTITYVYSNGIRNLVHVEKNGKRLEYLHKTNTRILFQNNRKINKFYISEKLFK